MTDIEPRTILVTGGCGFIGSAYIRHIARKFPTIKIVNLDCLTYAAHLEAIPDTLRETHRYYFHKTDICDRATVELLFKTYMPDYVVHFAAESHVDRSINGPGAFIRTNIEGTLSVLEAARFQLGSIKRFVMISTDEVYGSLEETAAPSVETDILAPRSPYSASKASAEHLAQAYHETYGVPVVVTRCSNNIGPWQHPEKVVPVFVINALRGKLLPIYGNGQAIRDYIHVEDHCTGIEAVREQSEPGEIYNIGGDNQTSGLNLAESILKHIPDTGAEIEYVKDRLGHDMRYSINCNKLKNLTGWKQQFDFEAALLDTIDWYQRHQTWWKKILD